jgi:putative DNA primase/helicase
VTDGRPARPEPLALDPEPVPETLTGRDQWVCWRYKWDADRDEWTKVPINVNTGAFASSTDPETWTSFATALAYHERAGTDTDGVGYVVHEDDTVLGVDLDDCRDPETGDLEPWAEDLLEDVPTYAEVSPSGTGLRLFGLGFVPDGGNRGDVADGDGHLELYDTGRYLTVTGHHIADTPEGVEQVNDEVDDVHGEYIADDEPERESAKPAGDGGVQANSPGANPTPDAEISGSSDLSDKELIEKAKNADNGDKFRRLWRGDTSGYPSHSEADLALVGSLAFWTGGDRRRIDHLFRQSDLYREKWDRDDYRDRTIDEALTGRTEFYDPEATSDEPSTPDEPDADIAVDDGQMDITLCPAEVIAWAGLGEDDSVADLTDREKAACVWELLEHTDEFHVRVRRDNGSLWAYDDGVWKPEGERALRHAARRALGSMNYGQNVLVELKTQARGDPRVEVEADEFGLASGTIAVENGLLYLDAAADGAGYDAIRELKPDDYALARLPVEYDPDATADHWRDLVDEWAEEDRADMLQEYVGYCLHAGGLPIHRALLLVGSGRNGKGTFLHVVRQLLGEDNTSSIELQTLANEKDALAEFHQSLANIDDDLSSRSLGKGLGMFKKLVGGDPVRARRLYQEGFQFRPTGKHLYAANEVPEVDVPDDDEAFWSRWIIVEFPKVYPPSQRDPGLRDELTQSDTLSGVLNWAIEGWRRLREQQEFTGEMTEAFQKRQRWQEWGDTIDKFISDCIEIDDDAENVSTSEVHDRYVAWCEQQGEQAEHQRTLTQQLKNQQAGYSRGLRIDGSKARGFQNVTFTDICPPPKTATDGDQQRLD